MPGIRTNAAAEVLGVSPNTLRSWERRYGFPTPKRTAGNHRNYELVELQTLRDALAQTGNISSAIELARQRQAAPASGGEPARRASRASTRTPPTARSRRAWRCARWSAPSRSCCCRRSTSSPPTPTARPSSSSPRAGRPAGCTAPAASPPPPPARPASCCSTPAAAQDAEAVHAQALDLDPAPRRLPRPDALQRARRRAPRARPAAPSTRPRSSSAAPAPTPPPRSSWSARSARLGFDAPLYGFRASGLIGDAVPSAGEQPERGHRDAQRRPAPPRRPGFRLGQKKPAQGPWAPAGRTGRLGAAS